MSDPQSEILIDVDVRAVAEFMQERIAASRLVAVADGLAALAPLLWGKYKPETVQTIRLVAEPIVAPRRPAASNE